MDSTVDHVEIIVPEKSVQEIIHIDTTIDSRPANQTDQVLMTDGSLSPTFKPDKLRELSEDRPL